MPVRESGMSAVVCDGKESRAVVEAVVKRRFAGDRGGGRRTAKDHGRCDAGLEEAIVSTDTTDLGRAGTHHADKRRKLGTQF